LGVESQPVKRFLIVLLLVAEAPVAAPGTSRATTASQWRNDRFGIFIY
jgi:hypothetical protein